MANSFFVELWTFRKKTNEKNGQTLEWIVIFHTHTNNNNCKQTLKNGHIRLTLAFIEVNLVSFETVLVNVFFS